MDSKKVLEYLTSIDNEIQKLNSFGKFKCPYRPLCKTYEEKGYWSEKRKKKICNNDKDLFDRWSLCSTYDQFVKEDVRKKVEVPEPYLSILMRFILSFEKIPCPLRKNCEQYSSNNEICEVSEEDLKKGKMNLGLVERMYNCIPYKDYMLLEIEETFKRVK